MPLVSKEQYQSWLKKVLSRGRSAVPVSAGHTARVSNIRSATNNDKSYRLVHLIGDVITESDTSWAGVDSYFVWSVMELWMMNYSVTEIMLQLDRKFR